jgi:hypothetical protein
MYAKLGRDDAIANRNAESGLATRRRRVSPTKIDRENAYTHPGLWVEGSIAS